MGRLVAELVQSDLGIQLAHVPYAGSAPAMSDVLGGRVNLSFDLLPTYTEHVRAGTLKALAVTGEIAAVRILCRQWQDRPDIGPRSDGARFRRRRIRLEQTVIATRDVAWQSATRGRQPSAARGTR